MSKSLDKTMFDGINRRRFRAVMEALNNLTLMDETTKSQALYLLRLVLKDIDDRIEYIETEEE